METIDRDLGRRYPFKRCASLAVPACLTTDHKASLATVKKSVKFDDNGNAQPAEDEYESEEDDSEDEEEDEEGEEMTPALDAAILRTLAMIRKKDEVVYGSGNVLEGEYSAPSLYWMGADRLYRATSENSGGSREVSIRRQEGQGQGEGMFGMSYSHRSS